MGKKIFENLLKQLRKADKVRKLTLAQNNDFETIEQYELYLTEQINSFVESEVPGEVELYDFVIAFDTTDSMSSYIRNVKDFVTKLVPSLFEDNKNLMLSVVTFGDYCDMQSSEVFGKAYQVIPLTNNVNELTNFIKKAKNTSGGDQNEFYELVIRKITNETNWREGSKRTVLLIADAEPHDKFDYLYMNKEYIDWKVEAKLAAEKNIVFDTVRITGNTWYAELSEITGGICSDFKSSNKTEQLVQAVSLARGGSTTRAKFETTMNSTTDVEIKRVYHQYSKILKK